jgi:hypothetical protein
VLPRLPLLDAVVVPITLGDLLLLVQRLVRSPSPLCSRFVPVEDHLFWERRFCRHKVRTLQLRKQGVGESAIVGGP